MTRESYWIARDRTRTKVKDMELSHIKHSLRMIRENNWRMEWKKVLEEELRIRNSPLYKLL